MQYKAQTWQSASLAEVFTCWMKRSMRIAPEKRVTSSPKQTNVSSCVRNEFSMSIVLPVDAVRREGLAPAAAVIPAPVPV